MLLTRQQLGAHVFASDDETRIAVQHLKIAPDGVVVATNGHVLVRVAPKSVPDEALFPPIPGLEGETPVAPVYLARDTAAAAAKIVPKEGDLVSMDRARLLLNGRVILGATDLRDHHLVMAEQPHDAIKGQFPDTAKVFPKGKGVITISLSAAYLALLAKYAKTFDTTNGAVTFTFYGPDQAVKFEWDDAQHHVDGCLMPMKV